MFFGMEIPAYLSPGRSERNSNREIGKIREFNGIQFSPIFLISL
jgi:hypothetical protein